MHKTHKMYFNFYEGNKNFTLLLSTTGAQRRINYFDYQFYILPLGSFIQSILHNELNIIVYLHIFLTFYVIIQSVAWKHIVMNLQSIQLYFFTNLSF